MYSEIVYNIYHFLMQVGFSSFYACVLIGALHSIPIAIVLSKLTLLLGVFYLGVTSFLWAWFSVNEIDILTSPDIASKFFLIWSFFFSVGAFSAAEPKKEIDLYYDIMLPSNIGIK